MDYVSYAIAVEELSRGCASTGVIVSAHNSLCLSPIYYFGTDEQKKKYLPRLTTGEWIGCFGITEPEAGSDAATAAGSALPRRPSAFRRRPWMRPWCTQRSGSSSIKPCPSFRPFSG
ncbi:MAG: hypothetical protein A2W19_05645 [Spirochaetes bacterium RBG_16_49_21]|nr:MAG: hypothetical protein A2W19_05645 [Spirochaetes bacterium RBG_16_49_21]